MKPIFFLLWALLACAGFSQAQTGTPAGELPEEAQRLKTVWQETLGKTVTPLRERYLADLARVMDQATREGKIDAANAVKEEIAAATPGATALAPAVPHKLPEDALRLQRAYQLAVKQAAEPLRQKYMADLRRVFDQVARVGRLPEATAVKAEIDGVASGATGGTDTVEDFERRFIGTAWMWSKTFRFTFEAGGKTSGDRSFSWKTIKPYVIDYKYPDGYHGTINFDHGLMEGKADETKPDGKKASPGLARAKS